jgi:hypothetical protein
VLLGTTTPTQAFFELTAGLSSVAGNTLVVGPPFPDLGSGLLTLCTTGARCNKIIASAPQIIGTLAPVMRARSDMVTP